MYVCKYVNKGFGKCDLRIFVAAFCVTETSIFSTYKGALNIFQYTEILWLYFYPSVESFGGGIVMLISQRKLTEWGRLMLSFS